MFLKQLHHKGSFTERAKKFVFINQNTMHLLDVRKMTFTLLPVSLLCWLTFVVKTSQNYHLLYEIHFLTEKLMKYVAEAQNFRWCFEYCKLLVTSIF